MCSPTSFHIIGEDSAVILAKEVAQSIECRAANNCVTREKNIINFLTFIKRLGFCEYFECKIKSINKYVHFFLPRVPILM